MQIEIDLEKADWAKYQTYVEKRLPAQASLAVNKRWRTILIWLLTIMFLLALNFVRHFDWPTALFVAAVFIALFGVVLIQLASVRKAFEPAADGVFCGHHKFTFTDEGIASSGRGYHGLHSWNLVKKVIRAEGMILIFLDTIFAYVLPESKLADPDALFEHVTQQYQAAQTRAAS